MVKKLAILGALSFIIGKGFAQDGDLIDLGRISGNFELSGQYYRTDSAISAVVPDEKTALWGFGNIMYRRDKFSAGMRFETYLPGPVGYPAGANWDGTGIGYRFARYSDKLLDITIGNFYEQFGSGMILRTWEDRGLGVDYALDGVRVKSRPIDGVSLTGLVGKQRLNFDNGFKNGDGIVRGLDGELDLATLLDSAYFLPGRLILGGSFVSKYQENASITYDFPENVNSWAGRLQYFIGGFQFSGEYAHIDENPSAQNSSIVPIPPEDDGSVGLFLTGQGVNLNASYSTRGFGVSFTASSLANMAFQSERNAGNFDLWINYLPPTSVLQTYLLGQFYPYATQPNGEVAYRGDVFFQIPKNTALGGKYGVKVDMSYARITNPEIREIDDLGTTRNGADISLFKSGDELYYSDFNVKVTKKISSKLTGAVFYMNTVYNNDVMSGAYDYDNRSVKGKVYADLVVAEADIKFNRRHGLRIEAQGLFTDQHLQDWVALVAEYTVSPHWFFSVLDQYNYGNAEGDDLHFPVASLGFIKGSSRVSMSYGRQRAGVFCVGGVCRVVPASNGLTLTLSSSF